MEAGNGRKRRRLGRKRTNSQDRPSAPPAPSAGDYLAAHGLTAEGRLRLPAARRVGAWVGRSEPATTRDETMNMRLVGMVNLALLWQNYSRALRSVRLQ